MHRTKLHGKLAMIAGSAAKTGQSSSALIEKINQLEEAIRKGKLIERLDKLLKRLEILLGEKRGKGQGWDEQL